MWRAASQEGAAWRIIVPWLNSCAIVGANTNSNTCSGTPMRAPRRWPALLDGRRNPLSTAQAGTASAFASGSCARNAPARHSRRFTRDTDGASRACSNPSATSRSRKGSGCSKRSPRKGPAAKPQGRGGRPPTAQPADARRSLGNSVKVGKDKGTAARRASVPLAFRTGCKTPPAPGRGRRCVRVPRVRLL